LKLEQTFPERLHAPRHCPQHFLDDALDYVLTDSAKGGLLMHVHDDSTLVSWEDAATLFELVGWTTRDPNDLQLAFACSAARAFAMHESRLVGVARAIGDGVYYATLVDVIVHPSFQRRGIGTALVEFVQTRLASSLLTTLTATPEVQPFYRTHGWIPQSTAMILPRSPQQAAANCAPDELERHRVSQTRKSIPMG
jgi:GNAT superfamily N-acetyltransferase